MSTDRVIEWPKHRACVPYKEDSRVVGFVIEPGDEAYGDIGLSEPLFWLDRMCKKSALPEPSQPAGAVDALERLSAKLRDISNGLPIGVFDKGSSEHLAETAAEIDSAIAALCSQQTAAVPDMAAFDAAVDRALIFSREAQEAVNKPGVLEKVDRYLAAREKLRTLYAQAIAASQPGQVAVPDGLSLMRSAFITQVSCGPDRRYEIVFKFRSLADMQQAYRDWLAAAPPAGDEP